MDKKSNASVNKIVQIDEAQIHHHLDRVVRGTVEETINGLLDAEAEQLCNVGCYERSDQRQDYRAVFAQAAHQGRGNRGQDAEVAQITL